MTLFRGQYRMNMHTDNEDSVKERFLVQGSATFNN